MSDTQLFPRTNVGGVSLSRMIIGTNWLLGWSHTGDAADAGIRARHKCREDLYLVFAAFLERGVDTVMAPFIGVNGSALICEAVSYAQEKSGKKLHIVNTPALDVSDNAGSRRATERYIKQSAEYGAEFCLLHHTSAESLVRKDRGVIERLDDYTKMIRDAGMIPGLSAHMPELVLYSDANGYDIETYIQIYNPMGFLMQIEIETVARIINNAKKPVMTIKPMAAGRCTPYVGFNFVWNTIRECDMVTVGATTAAEAAEDVEISNAAIERRYPGVKGRGSANENQAVLCK